MRGRIFLPYAHKGARRSIQLRGKDALLNAPTTDRSKFALGAQLPDLRPDPWRIPYRPSSNMGVMRMRRLKGDAAIPKGGKTLPPTFPRRIYAHARIGLMDWPPSSYFRPRGWRSIRSVAALLWELRVLHAAERLRVESPGAQRALNYDPESVAYGVA